MKRFLVFLLTLVILLGSLVFPAQAEGVQITALDEYATCKFTKDFTVYSGPGKNYVRPGGSTSKMRRNKSTYVFGSVGNWLLVGFEVTSKKEWAVGYVSKDALNYISSSKGSIPELTFQPALIGYADDNCRLTEDPLWRGGEYMPYKIPKGTAFTVLATRGKSQDWTYIEVNTDKGPMRGFVWSIHVNYKNGKVPATPIPTKKPTAKPTKAPTPLPTAAPYYYPTYPPYVPPTQAPYYPPTQPPYYVPTRAPYVPPTAQPTTPPYYTPTGVPGTYNTLYHDTVKGLWFPGTLYVGISGSWPVYSGPGTYYWRGAEGKAKVANSNCVVYGVENGWALIGYTTTNGKFRIGYISSSALPQHGLRIPYLDFAYRPARVTAAVSVNEDCMRYRTTVADLTAQTGVLFLGYINDSSNNTWAFVEVLVNNSVLRGFVPAQYVMLQ